EHITDEQNTISVDKLLVLTFTRAAAAEMRSRLSDRLYKLLEKNPNDRWIRKQLILLPSAQINTIDAFCSDLLRENASAVNLSPSFSIIDPKQSLVLLEETIDEVMETAYGDPNHRLTDLAEHYIAGDYNDKSLKAMLKQLYIFLQSCVFPKEWLERQIEDCKPSTPLKKTSWYPVIFKEITTVLEDSIRALSQAIALCQEDEKTQKNYAPNLETVYDHFLSVKKQLPKASWDKTCTLLTSLTAFPKIGVIRGDFPLKNQIKQIYDTLKEQVKATYSPLASYTQKAINEDRAQFLPHLQTLAQLMEAIDSEFKKKKNESDYVDYPDLERFALQLLIQRENGKSLQTELAKRLSDRFDEIYVDEYQDTNEIQDEIYMAISRDQTNLFFVGDVKQSIYSFRKARPDLFLKRRDSYTPFKKNTFPATITLDANFRSRKGIIDLTNFVFSQIMTKNASSIDYTKDEQLTFAATYEKANESNYLPELHLIDLEENTYTECGIAAEGRLIAEKIKEYVGKLEIQDGKETRPARFGDCCILLRNKKDIAQGYLEALKRQGIPAICSQQTDFYHSTEVSLVLSFLHAVDNPLDDIALTAILLSPIGNFTIDEIGQLRLQYGRRKKIYSILHAMQRDNSPLGQKIKQFLDLMEKYRVLASTVPVNQILDRIYHETDLLNLFATKENGEQRLENLYALYDVARQFEQHNFRGLSAFLQTTDRLLEQEDTRIENPTVQTDPNAVQIVSVHQSKGLEYPIVFLANVSHRFNQDDSTRALLLHPTTGIGMKIIDPETKIRHQPFMYYCVKKAMVRQSKQEEMRILYVAMTRAREKLVIVSAVQKLEKALASHTIALQDPQLPSLLINSASHPFDWLCETLLRHPNATKLLSPEQRIATLSCDTPLEIAVHTLLPTEEEKDSLLQPTTIALPESLKEKVPMLAERFAFEYPFKPLAKLSNKLAASEYNDQQLRKHRFVGVSKPRFMTPGLTAAEIGTAIHRFMQYADWSKDGQTFDYEKEVSRLLAEKRLNEKQGECVLDYENLRGIRSFFNDELYRRAQKAKRLWKELAFSVNIPTKDLLPKEQIQALSVPLEDIFVQGVVDCAFEEKDSIILIDYKSDVVSEAADLVETYRPQLKIYQMALEQVFDKPVTECYLYSLKIGDKVRVTF
ncbi:MAG: helicase-exonuclease AddAB subunit AddA, partial [Clostridia bacterium]|nr:helicase-exonuclease AddAB subunit AddA [Clostridia bacterium]